jgi:formate hydrogenlyase transcriptional activator
MAHKGTLFLDEIGDLPLDLQPKLLRALQEQEFERLGSSQTTRVDVRIIAATNQELGQMVRERRFRADLYYRLNVFPIALPPLRERKDDIPALVKHFVQEFASRMNRIIEEIPDQVIDLLRHYSWPGNIRELQNFVERGVLMSDDGVFRPDLSELTRISPEIASNERVHTLAEVERVYIAETLQRTNGVIGGARGAAAKLGIPRTTLISRMHKLGLSRDRAESAGFPSLPPHSAKCVGNLRITNGDSGGHPRVM